MSISLQAKHLKKQYKHRKVVKDVSLAIEPGEIVGLLGPNGAGKTTCFYMLVGLVSSSGGDVYLGDQRISHYPIHRRAQLGIGYLPQEASIFRKLTVTENILGILELRKHLTKAQRNQKLEQLLAEFTIESIAHSKGYSLSGGERRRVEIARALAMEPKFILLDEPFAGIDPISVIDIKKIITYLSEQGIGVLITDHNVRETLDICQKAYILSEGQLIAQGSANDILQNEQVKAVYLGEHFSL